MVTPHVGKVDLFKTSGHWQKYKDDLFPDDGRRREGRWICAEGHELSFPRIEIYKSQLRSYKELPLRYAEFGTVYRYEQSGELGVVSLAYAALLKMTRILFVTPDQLNEEFLEGCRSHSRRR